MNALADFLYLPPGKYRGPCPACEKSERDTAAVIDILPEGYGLWWCHRCEQGGRLGEGRLQAIPCPVSRQKAPQRWSGRADNIWNRARPLQPGDPVTRYLQTRRCKLPPEDGDLRCLPPSDRYPWPVMLARVSDAATCEPLSLHFTYLELDGSGKAPVEPSKRLLARHQKSGGCIRLWPDDAVTHGLALAEGIETALTIAHFHTPIWATVDAGNMTAFPLLDTIESITVFADGDTKGEEAARSCAQRWADAGREAWLLPAPDGADWNDVAGQL